MAVNRKRVARIMREGNLLAVQLKRFVRTTEPNHTLDTYVNLARRMTLAVLVKKARCSICAARPSVKRLTDGSSGGSTAKKPHQTKRERPAGRRKSGRIQRTAEVNKKTGSQQFFLLHQTISHFLLLQDRRSHHNAAFTRSLALPICIISTLYITIHIYLFIGILIYKIYQQYGRPRWPDCSVLAAPKWN